MKALCSGALLAVLFFPAFAQDPALRGYRDVAMGRDGDPVRGKELFFDASRAACSKCHSVDGSASKAGPALLAAGDKLPRREIIDSILEPSATIAIGYGATIVQTKSGDDFTGVIKQSTDALLELMTADGGKVKIPLADIQEQRGSAVS